jgi:hypothetical protein
MEILLKLLETVFYFFLLLFILNQHLRIKKYKLFYESLNSSHIKVDELKLKESIDKVGLAKNIGTIIEIHFFIYLFIGIFSSQSFLFLTILLIKIFSSIFTKKISGILDESLIKKGEIKFLIKNTLILTILILIIINKYFLDINFYNLFF